MPHSFRRSSLLAALVLLAAFVPLARPAFAANFPVSNLNDSGTGSLRAAITSANGSAGQDTITFSVAGKITLLTALPTLTDAAGVLIDGRNAGGQPTIEITSNGAVANGLSITSANNAVRGLIINGFSGAGINIRTTGATNNLIEQNYIGTNPAGSAVGSASSNNSSCGIRIQTGASTNTINNNVISGNSGYGIQIETFLGDGTALNQGNVITNNKIGLSVAGAALGNDRDGIFIGGNASNNKIGPGNVISANGPQSSSTFGIRLGGRVNGATPISGNSVVGNKIGTNLAGTQALPNSTSAGGGIAISISSNTTIGGPNGTPNTPGGDGNLISGNNGTGIDISDNSGTADSVSGLVLQNNWIGTTISGNAALPNTQAGVRIWKQAAGVTVGPNNVISGNLIHGVWLLGFRNNANLAVQTRNNTVTGNIIGAGVDATTAVPNGLYGIEIQGATTGNIINGNNRILKNTSGGIQFAVDDSATPLAPTANTVSGNTISGNGLTGIEILGGSGNTIGPSNTISGHVNPGTGVNIKAGPNTVKGNTITGNFTGISIGDVSGNTIGGPALADGNQITNNQGNGVLISGANATGNKITHTTTNGNAQKGIALTSGGNGPIAAASLTVTPPATGFNLTGTATGCTGGCTIEVFTDDSPLDNEGPTFLPVTPALNAINGAFSTSIAGCKHYLIFTLTDANGNTSEFRNPIGSLSQCVPSAPIVTITTDAPGATRGAVPGQSTTYHHTVTNSGTAPGVVSTSFSQTPNTWATLSNNTCTGQSLAPNATCTFDVVVTVPAGTAVGASNTSTVVVNIGSATKSQVDTTTALAQPSLTFAAEPPPGPNAKTVGSGQPVSYQHKLTNTGNGTDSFDITVPTLPAGWGFRVQPAGLITLAPGASTIVTVVFTPTAGLAPGSYAATVKAASHSLATVFQQVTDTTTITAAAVPQITSVITPANANQGAAVTIAYQVSNVGNITGTFNLVFSGPNGWGINTPPPATVSVNAGAPPATFNVVVQVPANAIAGAYGISLKATAQTTPFASATKLDQINVNKKAVLAIGPNLDDPLKRPPNTVITYTEQLTNTGNFTDTISLTTTTTRAGWTVRPIPTSVTLNPGATTSVKVEVTIPPGQAAGVNSVTTATATSSLPAVHASAAITTTIIAVSGVTLTPPSQTSAIGAGKPVTFTYSLLNSGSINQSYTITTTNVPTGWASSLTPLTTPTLTPGASQVVTFVLTPPAGTLDGTPGDVTITAHCVEQSCPDATATAHLTVGPPFNVGLGGVCGGSALPGAIVTCVHTITNTGFSDDNYLISVVSPLGWVTAVAPPSMFLAPNESRVITVTLAVPTSADAGLIHNLTLRVRSTASPSIAPSLVDTTTVLQVAGVSFSPSLIAPPSPGQQVEFQHNVLNTGNGFDSYIITATQDLDWSITIVPTQTDILQRGVYQTVVVTVQVPSGSAADVLNHITFRATSQFDATISDELVDTIGVAALVDRRVVYLPTVIR